MMQSMPLVTIIRSQYETQ